MLVMTCPVEVIADRTDVCVDFWDMNFCYKNELKFFFLYLLLFNCFRSFLFYMIKQLTFVVFAVIIMLMNIYCGLFLDST